MAQRHFGLARQLLLSDPNRYLSSSIDLDESALLWITGNIVEAIELAERGSSLPRKSGGRGAGSSGRQTLPVFMCALGGWMKPKGLSSLQGRSLSQVPAFVWR